MKTRLLLWLIGSLCYVSIAHANMANPVQEGSLVRPPFVREHVDVTREEIFIRLDSAFSQAEFVVDYYFEVDTVGIATPFVFHALDYKGDFRATLDGAPLHFSPLELAYGIPDSGDSSATWYFGGYGLDSVVLGLPLREPQWDEEEPLAEYWFFRAAMTPGTHHIRVRYLAEQRWRDEWDRITVYSFRYDLAPLRQWRSLDSLVITLDASAFAEKVTTNLGEPTPESAANIATWHFTEVPTDELIISYEPATPKLARWLLSVGVTTWQILLWALLIGLHIWLIRAYRKRTAKRFSPVVILGSIIGSAGLILIPTLVESIIHWALGPIASPMHGYWIFLLFFRYPLVLPFYWLFAWAMDRMWRVRFWA